MPSEMENWNNRFAEQFGFSKCIGEHGYGAMGQCWQLNCENGSGFLWAYGEKNLFDVKIHDFCFNEDQLFSFHIPGYLSVSYYDSVSGEQLTPYRRMNSGCLQCLVGSDDPYKIIVHKKIPYRSIGIGISPVYYGEYMKKRYPSESFNPHTAFDRLDPDDDFPELILLLKQIENYRGYGISAKMFYDSKVSEIVALLLERQSAHPQKEDKATVSAQDRIHIETAVKYINDHYSCEIPLETLSRIACMGTTKFRVTFKKIYGCTVMSYIQQRRLSHAECLLVNSDLTINQIAKSVGYSTSSRLAELFRQSTGLTPVEYRRIALKCL